METLFRQSFLVGTSESLAKLGGLEGCYDLMILASSWDQRCICIADERRLQIKQAIPIFFSLRDNLGYRDRHDKIIIEYCRSIASTVSPIRGASIDVDSMWRDLFHHMKKAYMDNNRPLNIFVDISTCPRYYFTAVCALAFKFGFAEKITFFYAEGEYPENSNDQEIAFTIGRWRAVPIPGLLGEYDPRKNRFYLVSIGFEGWKTLRVVLRADPDRVSILIGDPGFAPGYPRRSLENNRELFEQYQIPAQQQVRAYAGDAIAAWSALSKARVERPDFENTFYLCSGTKPHSLALALRAIILGYPAVLYNLPDEHKVVPTRANGRFWRYDVQDVTIAMPKSSNQSELISQK